MCRGASLGVSGCGFHGLLRLAGVNAAIYRVFLQRAKANALRLNELSHAELMYIAALTPTQLVIFKWAIQADRPACMYNCKMIVNKNTQGINALGVCFQVNSCIRGTSQKDWRHSLVSFCQCYL